MMCRTTAGGRPRGAVHASDARRAAPAAPLRCVPSASRGAVHARPLPVCQAANLRQQQKPAAPSTAASGGDAAARMAQELEALRRENALLKQQLRQAGLSGADTSTTVAAPEAPTAAAAAEAPVAQPPAAAPRREAGRGGAAGAAAAAGTEAFLRRLEAGVAWPDPSTPFWEAAPRSEAMPFDVGAGPPEAPPQDARPLQVVHFTAELAPIAKVGGLGDVVTGLARACLARGHAVNVLLPFYECLPLSSKHCR
ncbi:starch synthase [Monoraphidium neglectum]|uniref:starch synthase n=1 Tax=Monoraphidium neglectum TaxID=145388 RepID=A0A0D2KDI5_9CHLO|nr:starch synthase [Monoraphidium neglectum]KIY93888.1 starch synthase [Monoraphidium neglectum]|eukprot:XP_013892908.1 starch synthase [Monoraphidium neglectum]